MSARIGALSVAGLALSAAQGQILWDGQAGDAQWFSQLNWDPDSVPGSTSDAVIAQSFGRVLITSGDAESGTLNAGGGITLTNATLTLMGTSTIRDLILPAVNTELIAMGDVSLTGTALSNGGEFSGAGRHFNEDLLDIVTGRSRLLNTTMVNNDTLRLIAPGDLELRSSSILDNASTIELVGSTRLANGPGGGLVRNYSLISHSGVGTGAIACEYLQITGLTRADEGTLELTDAWSFAGGTIEALGANAVVDLAGAPGDRTITSTTLLGAGTIRLAHNPIVLDAALAQTTGRTELRDNVRLDGPLVNAGTMALIGFDVIGTGTLTNTGSLRIEHAATDIRAAVTNEGTITQTTSWFLGSTLTNEQSGTLVLAQGSILNNASSGRIVSRGTIEATPPLDQTTTISVPLDLVSGALTLRPAAGRGDLDLTAGGVWTGGTIAIDSLEPAIIRLLGSGSVVYSVPGAVTMLSTWDEGLLELGNGTAGGTPTLDINGSLILGDHTSSPITTLRGATLQGVGTFDNRTTLLVHAGSIGGDDQTQFSLLNSAPGGVVQFQPGSIATITASFTNNDLVNQFGPVSIDAGLVVNNSGWGIFAQAGIAGFNAGTFRNAGNFELATASAGSVADITAAFDNQGTVRAAKGILRFFGPVTQLNATTGELSGGTWIADNDGEIRFQHALVKLVGPARIVNGGDATMPKLRSLERIDQQGALESSDLSLLGGLLLDNASALTVAGDTAINGSLSQQGASTTTIHDDAELSVQQQVTNGTLDSVVDDLQPVVVLALEGPVVPPRLTTPLLVNFAHITLGGIGGTSPFDLVGDLRLESTGRLLAEIAPAGPSDSMAVTGTAELGGTLQIDLLGAALPANGDSFTIVSSTQPLVGTFDATALPALPGGLRLTVVYDTKAVRVVAVGCPADLTGSADPSNPAFGVPDDIVDASDFFYYLNRFAAGDLPRADLTGSLDPNDPGFGVPDGALDANDFFYYLGLFAQDCP